MAKLKEIEARGILNTMTYVSDSAGCGHIRCILPNTLISSWKYKELAFNFLHAPIFISQKDYYNHFSFVKFQRSATKDQLTIIKWFIDNVQNQTSTGVIYESDDNLMIIPESNFAHDYYVKNKPNIEQMLRIVDGITVSTGYLKKVYMKYNKNISVVKNRLCRFLWGDVNVRESFENVGDRVRILYPASQNHFSCRKDKLGGDVGPELMEFIKKTTDKYEWVFIGGIPQELQGEVKEGKVTYLSWVNILQYPAYLKSIPADIAIAPLEINDFNRAKSNLKMLEYSVCGLPAVYTNIDPYKFAKNKADTEEYFIHLIEMLASNVELRKKSWQHDYNVVKSDLYLEDSKKSWINDHLKIFNKVIK